MQRTAFHPRHPLLFYIRYYDISENITRDRWIVTLVALYISYETSGGRTSELRNSRIANRRISRGGFARAARLSRKCRRLRGVSLSLFYKRDRIPSRDIRYSLFDIRYSLLYKVSYSIKLETAAAGSAADT
jgi:hypothetical protein